VGSSWLRALVYPGIGTLIINAANDKDFPTLEAGVLFIGMVYLAATLIADVIYRVEPRIRLGKPSERAHRSGRRTVTSRATSDPAGTLTAGAAGALDVSVDECVASSSTNWSARRHSSSAR